MTTTNRWGMAALDTGRSSEAQNTEIMQKSAVGLIAVKSADGYPVSYDHITKFKLDYTDFKSRLIASGHLGKLVKIDLSDKEPVVVLNSGVTNAEALTLVTSKLQYIQFYVDVDVIDKVTGAVLGNVTPTVDIQFTVAKNTTSNATKTYNITGTSSVINDTVTTCDYTGYTADSTYEVVLNTFKVTLPSSVTADNYTIVVPSVMCAYKEVA